MELLGYLVADNPCILWDAILLWKSTFFPYTLTFWEGGGSQKVYGLYTHENVDIYGWPLINLKISKCLNSILILGHGYVATQGENTL